VLHFHKLDQ
jgi:hypothetical protein